MKYLAHRGLSARYPENTLTAFKHALKEGFDGIETDVQMTRDHHLILLHDAKINRTSNGSGYVRDKTYDELKEYNFNNAFDTTERLPLLEDLLELIHGSGKVLNLEIKKEALPGTPLAALWQVRERCMLDQTYFSSTSLAQLLEIKKEEPKAYCALIANYRVLSAARLVSRYHLDGVHSRGRLLKPEALRKLKERRLSIGAWTVKTGEDARYFREHGINFIFVNDHID